MNKWPVFFLLLFALTAPKTQAEIYKVIGADGKVSYTDKEPQSAARQNREAENQTFTGYNLRSLIQRFGQQGDHVVGTMV